MKKLLYVAIAIVIAVLLCGCSSIATYTKAESGLSDQSMFVLIENGVNHNVVYHKDTRVMYAVSGGMYNIGNFSVLVNADGSPMLYND